ncbi:flagellar hook-length control protein FliK [Xenorhabdus anantnagensis]|uniref:Flagellar hook-length control protein FliK n=1 Tax=Xenorhabdus anantnagensis TaxID=3025875 RepID=A0ABT5LSA5_9GAMM|nr:flagellar hook-length control protein FliK [Xenorhabdus anantnagensis]MDC9597298.1 flagellar hook-length control protein FliK [Xenorhabdus anantnagensis]
MNLTLLPTDLKPTSKGPDKNQATLNNPVIGNHSSQFGQLLNAETASMQKPTVQTGVHVNVHANVQANVQADKNNQVNQNNLKEGKPASDKTAKNGSPLTSASNNTVIEGRSQVETAPQENNAEFAVLKDEDLLSAEALSAAIPIQLVGLLAPHTNSVALPEDIDGLMGNESLEKTLLENALLENESLKNKFQEGESSAVNTINTINTNAMLGKSAKDSKLTDTELQDEVIQLSAKQETSLSNKAEGSANLQSGWTPLAGQTKLAVTNATNNSNGKAESGIAPLKNAAPSSKESNLLQMAIQAAPALTASPMAEAASVDSPALLVTSPLLSAGQHPTGQFQLSSATAPLLNAHLGSEEWQQQLNQHVLFFNRNGLQQAELRLHPQELGALHIRMSVEDNQAQLHFVSAHQNVRAALEAALPGLRHALAENGIQLAQSSVNTDAQGNGQSEHYANNHANNPNNNSNSHAENPDHGLAAATGSTTSHSSAIRMTPQQLASTRGGVDTFA